MAVKLRLMRMGKNKQPTYRVVAADARSPRDGRFIEIVGTYEPRKEPSGVVIDNEKALAWLRKGAQPTERVQKLLKTSGAWAEFKAAVVRPRSTTLHDATRTTRSTTRSKDDDAVTPADGRCRGDEYIVEGARRGARSVVDRPDERPSRRAILKVHVAQDDMGRVIGRRGRTAQAVRTLVAAAAVRDGVEVDVDFVDCGRALRGPAPCSRSGASPSPTESGAR